MPEEKFLLVKPREPDMVIRDDRSRAKLPSYGGRVPNNSYWVRRSKCKDVVPTTQEAIDRGIAAAKVKPDATATAKAEAPRSNQSQQKSSGKGRR